MPLFNQETLMLMVTYGLLSREQENHLQHRFTLMYPSPEIDGYEE
jgi:hypothetical protein